VVLCWNCGSDRTRRSRHKTWLESALLRITFLKVYRCRDCLCRFYSLTKEQLD